MKTIFILLPLVLSSTLTNAQVNSKKTGDIRGDNSNKVYYHPFPADVEAKLTASLVPTTQAADKARQLMLAKQYRQAEAECRRAISTSPKINGKILNKRAIHLLGEIYLAQGRNREALQTLLSSYHNTHRTVVDPDVALAYCRLGNYEAARQCYSDNSVLQYSAKPAPDMPGTQTPQSLEASILFARGMEAFMTSESQEALHDFEKASKLLPQNGLLAYYSGRALLNLERYEAAVPYFRTATRRLKGELLEDAKTREQNAIYAARVQREAAAMAASETRSK